MRELYYLPDRATRRTEIAEQQRDDWKARSELAEQQRDELLADLDKISGLICSAKLCQANSMSSRIEMLRLLDEALSIARARGSK